MASLIFITHPEVVIDPAVPIPQWPLSALGRSRLERFAADPVLRDVRAIYSSAERKAMDGAEILAAHLGRPTAIEEDLGENDRSSTGYIAPPEFWEVVEAFFSRPTESVRGWERACDAQARINAVVRRIGQAAPAGDVAIVAHGGVGSLLVAHLLGAETALDHAQPHGGGGCYFIIDRERFTLAQGWRVIDQKADAPA
jgi:broad specificity phosphatase PhoE